MIASAVAVIDNTLDDLASTRRILEEHPRIELGDAGNDLRWPLVTDADSPAELEFLHRWIESLPGIRMLNVVSVFYDDGSENDERNDFSRENGSAKTGRSAAVDQDNQVFR